MKSICPLLMLLWSLVVGLGCRSEPAASSPRNMVLVVVDTLRSDHLSAYGYDRETAPVISWLAAEGVRWNGVSPTSWTKPAVASILTGLHPLRHQAFGASEPLSPGVTTLAERLAAQGYHSLGIVANGWLSRKAGFARGFTNYFSMSEDLGYGPFSTGEEVNAEVFSRLAGLQPPFFLYVHYLDPHAPYEPSRDYEGRPLRGRLSERKEVGILELRMSEVLNRPAALLEDARDLYDGEIRQTDLALGRLLRELDRRGLTGGTLTVVTSDHGEEFQDHGRMGHGQSLYEEVVRVPLVFHAPGAVTAGLRGGTASLMDILPTALEILGFEPPKGLDGSSLVAAMKAPAPSIKERSLLLHLDLDAGSKPNLQGGQALGLRDDDSKLILAGDPRAKMYFDLRSDPNERSSRFGEPGLEPILGPRARALADIYNGFAGRAFPRSAERLEQQEALGALGYLGVPAKGGDRRIPPHILPADLRPQGSLGWSVR